MILPDFKAFPHSGRLLGIDWGLEMEDALVSEKDAKHMKLAEFDSPFIYKENILMQRCLFPVQDFDRLSIMTS